MRYFLFLIILFSVSCSRAVFKSKWTAERAPETFVARFETTKGIFDLQVTRQWSPLAADRFYQLVKHHYFDSAIFYRVIAGRIAQFGGRDSSKIAGWEKAKIADEPVVHGNSRGSISFARLGKETRGTDVFINLGDNRRLDTITFAEVKGFPSFGEVIKGMEVVSALYAGYAETPMDQFQTMLTNRNKFLRAFPQLDKIVKAYIVKH